MTRLKLKPTAFIFALFSVCMFAAGASADECNKRGGTVINTNPVVYFDTGSTAIKTGDKQQLREFSARVKDNPSIEICLIGQADKQGNAAANKKLSLRRAQSVERYLKANGLKNKPYQLVVRGEAYGDTWIGKLFSSTKFDSDRRVEVYGILN